MEHCEWFVQHIGGLNIIVEKCIMFSNEAVFHLNGLLNRLNAQYWATENPHWVKEVMQNDPRFMVEAALQRE